MRKQKTGVPYECVFSRATVDDKSLKGVTAQTEVSALCCTGLCGLGSGHKAHCSTVASAPETWLKIDPSAVVPEDLACYRKPRSERRMRAQFRCFCIRDSYDEMLHLL